MAKGDKVQQTNNSPNPVWQQLANMNLNYPTSAVQQPPYGALTSPMGPYNMNSYSMLNLPNNNPMASILPSLTGAFNSLSGLFGNSGLPNAGLRPDTSSVISNLFGGANSMNTMMNPNASSSLFASPSQSALTPSQNLIQQYFGQQTGIPQAPISQLNPGTLSAPTRSYGSPTPNSNAAPSPILL